MSDYINPDMTIEAVNERSQAERVQRAHNLITEVHQKLQAEPPDVAFVAWEMLRRNALYEQSFFVLALRNDYDWSWTQIGRATSVTGSGDGISKQAAQERFTPR